MKMINIKKSLIFSILCLMIMSVICIPNTYHTVEASEEKGSIILENTPSTSGISIEGKQFSAYTVFNIVYVDGYLKYEVAANFEDFFVGEKQGGEGSLYTFVDSSHSSFHAQAQEYIHTFETNMDVLVYELETYVLENGIEETYLSSKGSATNEITSKQTAIFENITFGYYLILDIGIVGDNNNAVVAGALNTVNEELTIQVKGSTPVMEKQIYSDNDKEWDNASSFEVGDIANYKVTSTIPSSVNGYLTYMYRIEDTMGDGLTFNHDVVVYVDESNENLLDSKYFTLEESDNSFILYVDVIRLKKECPEITTLYTRYSATVNHDLMIESEYNLNEVTLTYSNNPDDDDDFGVLGDDAYAYGFDLTVFKTMADEKTPLADAKFALYQIVDGEEVQMYLINVGVINGITTYYPSTSLVASNSAGIAISDETGYFKVVGLADKKDYILKEIEAPYGFNAIDPIYFTIEAEYGLQGSIVQNLEVSH